MAIQTARLANLRAVIYRLEQNGMASRHAQVAFFGNTITPARLQSMLEGGPIGPLFAEHVEHALHKPKGWMSEVHDEASDPPLERQSCLGQR